MNGNRAPFSANHFVATGFLVPAMVAVLFLTLVPMGMVLSRAFYDTQVRDAFPRTLEALSGWDGGGPQPERAHEALAQDLRERGLGGSAGRRDAFGVVEARTHESIAASAAPTGARRHTSRVMPGCDSATSTPKRWRRRCASASRAGFSPWASTTGG